MELTFHEDGTCVLHFSKIEDAMKVGMVMALIWSGYRSIGYSDRIEFSPPDRKESESASKVNRCEH